MGRRGRLPNLDKENRNKIIHFRVTADEKKLIETIAKCDKISVSDMIRDALEYKYGEIFEKDDEDFL